MAGGGPIIALIVALVTLTLGLLAFAQFFTLALPFLNDIITSDISPFAILLYSLIPFFLVFAIIAKALS